MSDFISFIHCAMITNQQEHWAIYTCTKFMQIRNIFSFIFCSVIYLILWEKNILLITELCQLRIVTLNQNLFVISWLHLSLIAFSIEEWRRTKFYYKYVEGKDISFHVLTFGLQTFSILEIGKVHRKVKLLQSNSCLRYTMI